MWGRGPTDATTSAAVLALAALVTGGGSSACSQTTNRQAFPGACSPFSVISSVPADGADQIPTDARLSLGFSDFPDPETVSLDTVLLSSGVQTRLGGLQVDLITRSIGFQIRNLLSPDLTYLVTVLSGVRSLEGCPVKVDQRKFHTGGGPTDPPPPPPPIPSLTSDVLPLFAARCGGSLCHRQPAEQGGGCLTAPAKGLSLCDSEAWGALVGAASTEVDGMRRVVPGDASRSFLMRKIIPGGPAGGPVPTTPGHRDPPDGPLGDTELRLISDWIDAGAAR